MKTASAKFLASITVATLCAAGPATALEPYSSQLGQNTHTTIQEGKIYTNDTFQDGDRNNNATYQQGYDNANRTRQRGRDNWNETGQFGQVNYNRTEQQRKKSRSFHGKRAHSSH